MRASLSFHQVAALRYTVLAGFSLKIAVRVPSFVALMVVSAEFSFVIVIPSVAVHFTNSHPGFGVA